MRHLPDIITKMVELAPELEGEFRSIKESSIVAPPEFQYHWWQEAGRLLDELPFSNPKREQLVSVFMGKS